MFVANVNFPPIKAGKNEEFQRGFAWSNQEFAKLKGFINRRLLKLLKEGNYAAVVEHERYKTFMAVHNSPVHDKAGKKIVPYLKTKKLINYRRKPL